MKRAPELARIAGIVTMLAVALTGFTAPPPAVGATEEAGEIGTAAFTAPAEDPLYSTCPGPGSDEFESAVPDTSIWTRTVNNPSRHRLENGAVVIPTYAANSSTAPLVLTELPAGAWEVTTEVTIEPTANYQQGGLMLWQDSSNFVVLDTYWSGQQRVQLNWPSRGVDYINLPVGQGPTFWFRLTSDGDRITGQYSVDGVTFIPIGRPVPTLGFAPTHVGPFAVRGATSTAPEIEATFDWFRFSPSAEQLVECGYEPGGPGAAEFDAARERWREVLVGADEIDPTADPYAPAVAAISATAQQHWAGLRLQPGVSLWADLNTTAQVEALDAFRRVKALALAWATPGSTLHGDPDLLADTIAAFDRLTAARYYPGMPNGGNWWYNEIGFPLEVNEITVLLYDELTAAQIDSYMDAVETFSPQVTSTGANRVWKAMVVGLRGLIVRSEQKLLAARDGLSPVFDYVSSRDGFYRDGSFIQHDYFAYTGGYGTSLMINLADLLLMLDDSPWEVVDPDVAHAYDWVVNSFDPVMYAGAMMDSVRGREISREYNQDRLAGATTLRAILTLAEAAPDEQRSTLRKIVGRHLTSGDDDTFWSGGSLTELALASSAIDEGSIAAPLTGTWAFNGMDRVVHHDEDFAFAIAMSSTRRANYESINNENFRSWYTADGMTYLYVNGQSPYGDDYWATVNRYRLPGTTVDTRPMTPTAVRGLRPATTFVGGVAGAAGDAAAVGMELQPAGTMLTGRKSWYIFDDEIVALGTGISATGQSGAGWDGEPRSVETTVENTRLGPDASGVTVDGAPAARTAGQTEQHAHAKWAHVSGTGGYFFPGRTAIEVLRETRSGSWFDINSVTGSATVRSNEFASIWVDHGTNPSGLDYEYVVLPGADRTETADYAEDPDIRVLANSSAVSAVEEKTLNAIGANFWTDEPATLERCGKPYLTSNARASVTTEESAGSFSVTVVDTTQQNAGSIVLELHRSIDAVEFLSPGVSVEQRAHSVLITIAVGGSRGAPFEARFGLPD